MKKYGHILFIIAVTILLFGCGVSKEKVNTDKTKTVRESEKKITFRPSDTVVSETKYNVKYKDTTIVTTNYKTNTILREVYDDQGNRRAECIPEEIREEISTLKEEIHNDIESIKNTEHTFDIAPLIWALSGFAFVILLIVGVLAYTIISIKNSLPDLVKTIVKESIK